MSNIEESTKNRSQNRGRSFIHDTMGTANGNSKVAYGIIADICGNDGYDAGCVLAGLDALCSDGDASKNVRDKVSDAFHAIYAAVAAYCEENPVE